MEEKVTVAVLTQKLDDHLQSCANEGASTNRRLGRIEGVLIAVAGAAILQLLAVVGALIGFIASRP